MIDILLPFIQDGISHAVSRIEQKHDNNQLTRITQKQVGYEVQPMILEAAVIDILNGMFKQHHQDENALYAIASILREEIIIIFELDTPKSKQENKQQEQEQHGLKI